MAKINGSDDERVLSVEEILAADDITYDVVEAWGGRVRIGSLDAGTMLEFIKANENPTAKHTAGLRLLIASLVDRDGKRIGDASMMEAFKRKNMSTVNRVVERIMQLNGIGKTGVDLTTSLREAGTDPVKLKAVVEELRGLADAVEAAGTDEKQLQAVLDAPRERARADAKNV